MQASNSSSRRHADPLTLAALATAIFMVAILVLGLGPSPAGAKGSLGGTLSGSTAQGNPGWIKVSSSGRTIRESSITIDVKCPVGVLPLPQKVRSIPITPGGRFKATLEDTSEKDGTTLHLFESFSGKFNSDRTNVTVKSRIRLNFQEADGSTETCDSGAVTMHASR